MALRSRYSQSLGDFREDFGLPPAPPPPDDVGSSDFRENFGLPPLAAPEQGHRWVPQGTSPSSPSGPLAPTPFMPPLSVDPVVPVQSFQPLAPTGPADMNSPNQQFLSQNQGQSGGAGGTSITMPGVTVNVPDATNDHTTLFVMAGIAALAFVMLRKRA